MRSAAFFLFCLLLVKISSAQSVAVSGYFNAADPRDEWTELIVITDNTDMRNWSIRDDNSSQNSWQTAVTFNNIAFWNNMRAGTIIVIWHRPIKSDGVTTHPIDVNKADGYIELDATNTTYFGGGAFGSSPAWGGASLNIAGGGDVVQLRDASNNHVHALGHISGSTGADWNALPSPKLNHANSANSGDAVYVCPGDIAADYGTTGPQSGTTWTSKNNGTITQGLPNISGSSPIQNTAFWDTLREPAFANQTVAPSSVTPGNPGSISFSWTAATDPNSADATTGYVILRNTVNTFTAPADGTTYTNGSTLGSATVLAHIGSSATTSYTDNTVMNGNSYYYRVYAYRYTTDDINGNTFHRSRGRAYSSTFVLVIWPTPGNPLPVELISFAGTLINEGVLLNWTTESEVNNDHFLVQRAGEGMNFSTIAVISGNGTTSMEHNYAWLDKNPVAGRNYYRLDQVDVNGVSTMSNVVCVVMNDSSVHDYCSAWNDNGNISFVVKGWQGNVLLRISDVEGREIFNEIIDPESAGSITLTAEHGKILLAEFISGDDRKVIRILY